MLAAYGAEFAYQLLLVPAQYSGRLLFYISHMAVLSIYLSIYLSKLLVFEHHHAGIIHVRIESPHAGRRVGLRNPRGTPSSGGSPAARIQSNPIQSIH